MQGEPMYSLENAGNAILKTFGSGHSVKWEAAHRFLTNHDAPMLAALPEASVGKAAEAIAQRRGKRLRCTRTVVHSVILAVLAEFIQTARGAAASTSLSLCELGELVYTGSGVGARGHLALRFRRDFLRAVKETRTSALVARPRESRREATYPTFDNAVNGDGSNKKNLFEAPGSSARRQSHAQLETRGSEVVERVRARLTKRTGIAGICLFVKALESVDEDGELDANEVRWGLRDFGIEISERDALAVVELYDRDGGGTLSVEELVQGIRGENSFPACRQSAVERTFQRLLTKCRREGDQADLDVGLARRQFNPYSYGPLKEGEPRLTAEAVTNDFFAVLDASHDGTVSQAEFFALYQNISAATDDDALFLAHLEESWTLAKKHKPGRGAASKPTNPMDGDHADKFLDDILDRVADRPPPPPRLSGRRR